jgi:hypothetical protein
MADEYGDEQLPTLVAFLNSRMLFPDEYGDEQLPTAKAHAFLPTLPIVLPEELAAIGA